MELGEYLIKMGEEMGKAKDVWPNLPSKVILYLDEEGKVKCTDLQYGGNDE